MTVVRRLFRALSIATLTLACAPNGSAAPISILFVGNSYTFGRVAPVLQYNAANVHDLTSPDRGAPWTNTTGSNVYETHNWGGVPGIFKAFTDEAGLNYDVSISARNAASLRGQYLTTNGAGWDMLGNIASQKWDNIVLQDLSDEPLPNHKGANANLALFSFYANKIEDYIHNGIKPGQDLATDVLSTTEGQLWGGPASGTAAVRAEACIVGTGGSTTTHPNPDPNPNALSQGSCNTARTIKGNANENAAANVYLYETWARPDMVFGHTTPTTDPVTGAISYPTGNPPATLYEPSLQAMTDDLHSAYYGLAASNPNFKGVAGVGDAFMRAVNNGMATSNFYAADALTDGLIDLWWDDGLHASKYGSYLSALVLFQTITGRNALSLGPDETAAADLGIASDVAVQLQRIAQDTVAPDTVVPTTDATANPPANANGWNNTNVTVTLTAIDNPNGSGVKQISFATSGAQVGSGIVSGDTASLTIGTEGQTIVTYYATDNAGNIEAAKTLTVQLDKTPPSISGMPNAGCEIWPANHKFVLIATVAANGGLSGLASFNTNVTSSEPASPGQSDIMTTGSGLDPRIISLRAERLGNGPGRTYTLSASATDRAGNVASVVATCVVPHDKGH